MMARQHVTFAVGLTGTALATTAYFNDDVASWVTNSWPEVVLFLTMIAGGALVPDIDHHGSTLTKKLGWLGAILSWMLRAVGIKHRGFLHTFLFALISGVVFFGIEALMSVTDFAVIGIAILVAFYASVTFGFMFGRYGRFPIVPIAILAGVIYGADQGVISFSNHWLALSAFLGPLLHCVGDMMTHGRLAFWYPFSKKRYGAPVTFRTNSLLETAVLRYVFFAWSLLTFAWVAMMATGHLEPTDFSASGWFSDALPFVVWSIV